MRTVWVVNHREQDVKAAATFGDIKILIEGKPNIFGVDRLIADLKRKLKVSKPDDYVVPCGSLLVNMLVGNLMLKKHGKYKLLLFDFRIPGGGYVERTVDEGDFDAC